MSPVQDSSAQLIRPPARPTLSRSQSDLSVAQSPIAREQLVPPVDRHPTVLVKKRHSTFISGTDISDLDWKDPAATPPHRPPRNPARAMNSTASAQAGPSRPRKSNRPSTATGTREEVTPWELYPAPDYTSSKPTEQPPTRPSTRPTTANHNGPLNFVESAFVRRRKSTGGKSHKPKVVNDTRPMSQIEPTSQDHPMAMAFGGGDLGIYSPVYYKPKKSTKPTKSPKLAEMTAVHVPPPTPPTSTIPQPFKATPPPPPPPVDSHSSPPLPPKSTPPLPPAPPTSHIIHRKPSRTSLEKQAEQNNNRLKFSTADRTILEELKRNITARASQFVYKGGSSAGWGVQGIGAGKKHHPYPREEVPYPRSYDREVVDLDVWETMFSQQICDSLTWHVFTTPPTKVLDIGCGPGTWLLNCARSWKECHFVGLDIVPLHPDLQQVGYVDLASRITWVQGNFLEGLPFPNEEFDYVHVKRIALGVPEDKWDSLFEEITRVMKPGAAFELVEEDLFFPGQVADAEDEEDHDFFPDGSKPEVVAEQDHDTDSGSTDSRRNSATLTRHSDETNWSQGTTSTGKTSPRPPGENALPPKAYFPSQSTSGKPMSPKGSREPIALTLEEQAEIDKSESRSSSSSDTPVKTHNRSATFTHPRAPGLPASHLQKSPSVVNIRDRRLQSGKDIATPPPPALSLKPQVPAYYGSSGFHLPTGGSRSQAHGAAPDWLSRSLAIPPGSTISTADSPASKVNNRHSTAFGLNDFPPTTPFIHRSLPKAPANPRDHSLLETIYNEMCGSRFINLAPLSLLANLVVLHFKDVRTHPPLQLTFPPLPIVKPRRYAPSESDSDEEARDAVVPSPTRGRSRHRSPDVTPRPNPNPPAGYFDEQDPDQKRFLSIRGLIHGTSPYVSLDDTRISAFSPSPKSAFQSPKVATFPKEWMDRGDAATTPRGEGLPPANGALNMVMARAATLSARKSRLPNTTIRLDLRTLNLHLALRVTEVLGCSEAMWEWVQDVQKERKAQKAAMTQRARSGSGSIDVLQKKRSRGMSHGSAAAGDVAAKRLVYELTREEFEGLLFNFEMDMHDQMTLGSALRDRFPWFSPHLKTQTSRRKLFETACEQWQQWDQDHPPGPKRGRPSFATSRDFASKTSFSDETVNEAPSRVSNATSSPTASRGNSAIHDEDSSPPKKLSASISSIGSTVAPPTHKLSRSFRVFVAWKPQL